MERIGGGPHQRGPTTTLAAASIHSTTLRDSFLASDMADRNRSHSDIARTSSLAGLTLEAVLNIERSRSSPTNHNTAVTTTTTTSSTVNNNSAIVRTLLDILQNEQALIPTSSNLSGKKTWKSLKDRLKLRRLSANTATSSSSNPIFNWTGSQPVSRSSLEVSGQDQLLSVQATLQDAPRRSLIQDDSVPADERLRIDSSVRHESGGGGSMRLSAALAAEREETRRRLPMQLGEMSTDGESNEGRGHTGGDPRCSVNEREGNPSGSGEPLRMSLMDLLEETDRHGGIQGETYRFDPEDGEEDEQNGGVEGVGEVPCCVCLVRHKGAAFIPCGHTFCRLCSRELWVQRGHCPICNNFIVEILDIF